MQKKYYNIKIISLFVFFAIKMTAFSNLVSGQECVNFLKTENCQIENLIEFKLSSLSRKHSLKANSTVTYEVVLYGGNEIIIKCCTEDDFYPVRFKLKSSENGKIIYDNKFNKYIDNLNLLLDHTELIAIEISIDPNNKKLKKNKDKSVCVGMAIYTENIIIRN